LKTSGVRPLLRILATAVIALAHPIVALAAEPDTAREPASPLATSDAVVLGFVEGVTEFLPISSTGHLIIANRALGLDSDLQLTGTDGALLWHRPPSSDGAGGVPLTRRLAADTFTVVIQFGAIAAVALLYWRRMRSMVLGLAGRDPEGLMLLRNLIVAFIPAAAIGFLAHDWIEANLFSVPAVIAAQVAGGLLMLYAERWRRLHGSPSREIDLRSALRIGILQCFALWPGTSRSMMTIVGGYFSGLEPRKAAEFSFLLGFVTLTAASAYSALRSGPAMIAVFGWPNVLLGSVVAALAAAAAVRFLVSFLTRHGLAVFAVYRFLMAGALAIWMGM
jgi:undecaprenyl-diphosphatase